MEFGKGTLWRKGDKTVSEDISMSEEVDDIVKGYIEWARVNAIPVSECDAEDIEEYMLRRFKAAG